MMTTSRETGAVVDMVRFQIEGRLKVEADVFVAFATKAADEVRESEPGATGYRWHLGPDAQTCLIEEEYSSSDAFVSHMKRFRDSGEMRELAGLLTIEGVTVLSGDPEVLGAQLRGLQPSYFRTVATL